MLRCPLVKPDRRTTNRKNHSIARTIVCVVICAAASPAALYPQVAADSVFQGNGGGPAALHVQAAYRTESIRVDGRVEESAWQDALPIIHFVQREPVEGAAAEEATVVRVLFDERALYVGVVMHDRNPGRIGDQLVRRDEEGQYDYFELSLDPNNDRRTGYRFRVSAAGVQRDVYLFDDTKEDDAWDAVWESGVHRDSTGWSAELRIPLSQLRYEAREGTQSWGVNFSRRRLASNELTYFALESQVSHGVVSVFGQLDGLQISKSARRIELRPYALTRAETAPSEAGDPFFDGSDFAGQAGLDLRYGLGGAFTLDVTFNPDFGQVEVDPAVINLTEFEVFFPERRPFFVEDAQIFDYDLAGRQSSLYYSRRIGREPQGESPGETDFEEIPRETTIITAAKLTGRTSSGLSLGALGAITAPETGHSFHSGTGETTEFTVEPASQFGVVRAQKDFRRGASVIGGIFTGMHRSLPSDSSLDFLTSSAFSAGFDFEHNWGGPNSRNWALWGYAAQGWANGSTVALLEVQTSSTHFYQRPDATRFSVDSTRTSLGGLNWRLQFERRSARHWTGAVWLGESTPGFEINDLGFWQSNERLDIGARIGYQEITPGSLFRSYQFRLFTFHNFRHEALDDVFSLDSWDRARKRGTFSLEGQFEFLNYWNLQLQGRHSPERLSDTDTRGGPLMTGPASSSLEATLGTDRRQSLFLGGRVQWDKRHRGGYKLETGVELAWRPASSFEIAIVPSYIIDQDLAQYVETTDDVGYDPTIGPRYLFADLDRTTLQMETRLNIAFNNRLTLQVFAQPLIDTGDYITYRQLEESETFDFEDFTEGSALVEDDEVICSGGTTCVVGDERYVDLNSDGTTDFSFGDQTFNIRSLRMNAVLRWEYRPGSTIFLVWQQSRRDEENIGGFDFGRDARALLTAEPENVLILKVNYWLGL